MFVPFKYGYRVTIIQCNKPLIKIYDQYLRCIEIHSFLSYNLIFIMLIRLGKELYIKYIRNKLFFQKLFPMYVFNFGAKIEIADLSLRIQLSSWRTSMNHQHH